MIACKASMFIMTQTLSLFYDTNFSSRSDILVYLSRGEFSDALCAVIKITHSGFTRTTEGLS